VLGGDDIESVVDVRNPRDERFPARRLTLHATVTNPSARRALIGSVRW
jgi:hypothetical protein